MDSDIGGKTESAQDDPGQLAHVLELELMRRRAALQHKSARYRSMRAMAWLLIVVIAAGLVAALFIGVTRLSEQRAKQPDKIHLLTPKP